MESEYYSAITSLRPLHDPRCDRGWMHALLPGMTIISGADDHAGRSLKMIAGEAAHGEAGRTGHSIGTRNQLDSGS